MTKHIPNASKQRNILSKEKNSISPAGGLSSLFATRKNNDFSLSYLTELSPTLILRTSPRVLMLKKEHASISPPWWAQSPLTFQAEHGAAVPWGPVLRAVQAAGLTQLSQPPRPALPAKNGAASQRRGLQEATAQSQLSGLSCWHLPIFHGSFTPWNQPGSSGKVRGAEGGVAVHVVQCRGSARAGFGCLYLSAFPIAADGAPHVINNTKRNPSIRFHCLLLIITTVLCHHYSFASHILSACGTTLILLQIWH